MLKVRGSWLYPKSPGPGPLDHWSMSGRPWSPAKDLHLRGYYGNIRQYKPSDVPIENGRLSKCDRLNCRKLFHGIRMQVWDSQTEGLDSECIRVSSNRQ